MQKNNVLDIIGIGLGPFNLSLATLLTKQPAIKSLFFEQKKEFNWHKSMILPHTTLQVPFMADLVTLIDPTSRYTFLNYLHTQHRLLKFYFLEDFEIYRQEYNHYCQWVASQLDSLVFDTQVMSIIRIKNDDLESDGSFEVTVCEHGENKTYIAKNLVIGTGSTPVLPPFLQAIADQAPQHCMHTTDYANRFDLEAIKCSDRLAKVLVIGSGQSAAEVYRALFEQQLDNEHQPKFELDWMTRSAGFFPMEYAPLGLEHFSPAYIDYFHALDTDVKTKVVGKQDLLHKGISFKTIRDIYHMLYERSIGGQALHSKIMSNCALLSAELDSTHNDKVRLTLKQHEQDQTFTIEYDCVIAGTGYSDLLPACLESLIADIEHDASGQPVINRDYTLNYKDSTNSSTKGGRIFVQNKETHSHGVGAGDLGLGAYRAGCIVNQLAGETIYDTEALEVFQTFGVR